MIHPVLEVAPRSQMSRGSIGLCTLVLGTLWTGLQATRSGRRSAEAMEVNISCQ